MAKVKPYIITVKYVGFYEDPRPTVEQIANEINIDALEIHIEEAIVTAAPKIVDTPPAIEYDVESRTVTYMNAAIPSDSEAVPFSKEDAPFDTYNLDREGPSLKILSALYGVRKGRKLSDIKQVTALRASQVAYTISRLKKTGRIKVAGKSADGSAIYVFVK